MLICRSEAVQHITKVEAAACVLHIAVHMPLLTAVLCYTVTNDQQYVTQCRSS
jgi:hypothetical protein